MPSANACASSSDRVGCAVSAPQIRSASSAQPRTRGPATNTRSARFAGTVPRIRVGSSRTARSTTSRGWSRSTRAASDRYCATLARCPRRILTSTRRVGKNCTLSVMCAPVETYPDLPSCVCVRVCVCVCVCVCACAARAQLGADADRDSKALPHRASEGHLLDFMTEAMFDTAAGYLGAKQACTAFGFQYVGESDVLDRRYLTCGQGTVLTVRSSREACIDGE
eukprot:COSAG02_NODE_8930_length_2395_cov_3.241289_1_plen_224_part_00